MISKDLTEEEEEEEEEEEGDSGLWWSKISLI